MTQRQAEILTALIEMYAQSAEPVGSVALSEQFSYSPATIRAEMAALEREGYIMQPHISAGRVPTDKGYRSYVNGLDDQAAADRRISRVIAKRVMSEEQSDRAIKAAADALVAATRNLGLATLSDSLYLTGMSNLFGQPEFAGGTRAYEVARLLDSLSEWLAEAAPGARTSVYIGRENPIGKASGASLIITRFASPHSDATYIGVLGPTRQRYGQVIGLVDYTGKLLEETLHG